MESTYQRGIRIIRGLLGETKWQELEAQVPGLEQRVGTAYERQARRNAYLSQTETLQREAGRRVNVPVTPQNLADFVEGAAMLEKLKLPKGVMLSMQRMGYNPRAIYSL